MSSERDEDPMELDNVPTELNDDADQDDFEHFEDDASEVDGDIEGSDSDSDDSIQKDDAEEELERLVFGDTAAFKEDIKTWKADRKAEVTPTDQSLTAIDDGEVGRLHWFCRSTEYLLRWSFCSSFSWTLARIKH